MPVHDVRETNDGAPGPIRNHVRWALDEDAWCEADRQTGDGPGRIDRPVGPHMLRIHGVLAGAKVLPGDDGPAQSVGNDRGTPLGSEEGCDYTAADRPRRVHRAIEPDVVRVDVCLPIAAVLPGDDRSSDPVGLDLD